MKMCKTNCGAPVEAERYEYCYNCWWAQDPRNTSSNFQYPTADENPENFSRNNAERQVPTVDELTTQFMKTLPSSMGGPILESIARAFAVQHRDLYIKMYSLLERSSK